MINNILIGFYSMAKSSESARGYSRLIGTPLKPACSKFGFSDNLFLNFSIGSSSGGCAGPFCASMTGGGNSLFFFI